MHFQLRKLWADNKDLVFLLLAMLLVRSSLANWYEVPSSSMYPNLLEGDRVFCSRIAYDIRLPFTDIILKRLDDPQRGDIVTFSSPEDGVRLVKRLVAVPGDVVEMREEKLFINGQPASYSEVAPGAAVPLTPAREYAGKQVVFREQTAQHSRNIIVMPERPAMRSFGPVTVPADQYLMLGDNRDNSKDSRYIGFVKRELITGKVKGIMFSLDGDRYYLPRLGRFGAGV